MNGLLIVDKPPGPTSHDVVQEVRRLAGGARVGHTGTLDPLATGVLPLCVGKATRLARFLSASRKTYEGTMRLGVVTDTYDGAGRPIREADPSGVDEARVRREAARFVGAIQQVPPPYSARRIGGRRLHDLARAGRMVALPASSVTVHRFDILEVEGTRVRFVAETSAGTYVRSLAHDLGGALGCGAHLEALRRLGVGALTVDHAIGMPALRTLAREKRLHEALVPMESIDLGMPTAVLALEEAAALRNGRAVCAGAFQGSASPSPGLVRVLDETGALVGVAMGSAAEDGHFKLQPEIVLSL